MAATVSTGGGCRTRGGRWGLLHPPPNPPISAASKASPMRFVHIAEGLIPDGRGKVYGIYDLRCTIYEWNAITAKYAEYAE